MKITINISEIVKVKLTEFGEKVHKEYWLPTHIETGTEYKPREKDKEGYTEFQIHELLNIFGHCRAYSDKSNPFDSDIVIERDWWNHR